MDFKFNMGDKVIRADGLVGQIDRIDKRRHYKGKSFLEYHIKYVDGTGGYIDSDDKTERFERFYQIGGRVFGNCWLAGLLNREKELKSNLEEIQRRITVLRELENTRRSNNDDRKGERRI